MSENKIQKKVTDAIKEKTQYALAFGVIATMLFVAGFPMFIIIFFAIFAYFLWKTFAGPNTSGTREVFEFYLSANEILRDDERRWFGFEVQDVIGRGEQILQTMNGAPPLVYFTLGALLHKAGNHESAVSHLAYVIENENADEKTYLYASPELKSYVRILRKIEREPSDAPQTSAAVRALERARRNRGKTLLEESRNAVKELNRQKRDATSEQSKKLVESNEPVFVSIVSDSEIEHPTKNGEQAKRILNTSQIQTNNNSNKGNGSVKKEQTERDTAAHRRSISEVLHDIYDDK